MDSFALEKYRGLKEKEFDPLEGRNFYQVLGVQEDASYEEIQRAFRKLIRKFHQDRDKTEHGERATLAILAAWEILSKPEKRKRYDALAESEKKEAEFLEKRILEWIEKEFTFPSYFSFKFLDVLSGNFDVSSWHALCREKRFELSEKLKKATPDQARKYQSLFEEKLCSLQEYCLEFWVRDGLEGKFAGEFDIGATNSLEEMNKKIADARAKFERNIAFVPTYSDVKKLRDAYEKGIGRCIKEGAEAWFTKFEDHLSYVLFYNALSNSRSGEDIIREHKDEFEQRKSIIPEEYKDLLSRITFEEIVKKSSTKEVKMRQYQAWSRPTFVHFNLFIKTAFSSSTPETIFHLLREDFNKYKEKFFRAAEYSEQDPLDVEKKLVHFFTASIRSFLNDWVARREVIQSDIFNIFFNPREFQQTIDNERRIFLDISKMVLPEYGEGIKKQGELMIREHIPKYMHMFFVQLENKFRGQKIPIDKLQNFERRMEAYPDLIEEFKKQKTASGY